MARNAIAPFYILKGGEVRLAALDFSTASNKLISQVLGSTDFAGFLKGAWETSPNLTRGATGAVADLVQIDDIERLIASGYASAEGTASVVEAKMAQRLSACTAGDSDWLGRASETLMRGGSLALTGLQRHLPQVGRFCRAFDNAFLSHGVPLKRDVFANAYLTPPNAQGFGLHYDDHCVVVIQLEGRKHWTVHAPKKLLPTTPCDRAFSTQELGSPILETELCAGDALYLPRGFPHAARCFDTTSLHLTLGIQTVPWSTIPSRLANGIGALRSGIAPNAPDGTPAASYLHRALAAIQTQLDPSDILMDLLCESLSGLPPLPGQRLAASMAEPPHLGDTVVRAAQVLVLIRPHGERVSLHAPGCALSFPAEMHEALEFVAETDCFVVGDIPSGPPNFDRAALVALLLSQGVLAPAPPAGSQSRLATPSKEVAYDSL